MTLTIFQAGNSQVIAIPRELREKYGWKTGSKINLKDTGKEIVIELNQPQKGLPVDLKSWLEKFDKKHAKALRELAKR